MLPKMGSACCPLIALLASCSACKRGAVEQVKRIREGKRKESIKNSSSSYHWHFSSGWGLICGKGKVRTTDSHIIANVWISEHCSLWDSCGKLVEKRGRGAAGSYLQYFRSRKPKEKYPVHNSRPGGGKRRPELSTSPVDNFCERGVGRSCPHFFGEDVENVTKWLERALEVQ
jgi:hypothetical protein